MTESSPGSVGWRDLTVDDAPRVRDFYAAVAGWTAVPIDMGGYDDYAMVPPGGGAPVAGICHRRGPNQDLPPQWLLYIVVADLDAALAVAAASGGRVEAGPRPAGGGRFALVRDPAGALVGLYSAVPSGPSCGA